MSNKRLLVQKAHLPETLDVCMSTIDKWIDTNRLPQPVGKAGNRFLWSIDDLKLWVSLNMPSNKEFEEHKKLLTK